ncbi:ankyrin repeat [Fusarium albosuccineum]|uniref:Ankyrin repeat n=1 Tax=Fusarium albosuccineum TaxID=1237068 RepID=A0A8H4LCH1_9HYPO|nr:ankyrin repeat [Fusarium albosuccineum]
MRKVLDHCPETNIKDSNGLAPIHQAALDRQADAIDVLLEFKAEVDVMASDNYYRHTPLIMATINQDLVSIQSLLEGGADVDCEATGHSCTALQHASTPEVIGAILQYYPNVDFADSDGDTALQNRTAEAEPNLSAIKKLVNARADVNTVSDDGCYTPLMRLANNAHGWPAMEYLISKGADIHWSTFQDGTVLHRACYRGDVQMVKHLHAAGAKADIGVGGFIGSPLQAACLCLTVEHDDLEIIDYLITEAKADVNQVCGLFGSALSAACLRESPDALKLLLGHGAAADFADQVGRSPIQLAAVTLFDSFQHLLNVGCDVHATDKTGRTVLQWAAQSGDVKIVELILSYPNTAVDQEDKDGWTALCWAARGMSSDERIVEVKSPDTQADIVELLLERGARKSLSVRGDASQIWSPLQIAVFHNSGEKVMKLLAVDEPTSPGPSPSPSLTPSSSPKSERAGLDRAISSSETGHRHGDEICESCLALMIGTKYACKSCPGFNLCFKCYFHREWIHDPLHEFEECGPTFDEPEVTEDDGSETGGSEISIEVPGV